MSKRSYRFFLAASASFAAAPRFRRRLLFQFVAGASVVGGKDRGVGIVVLFCRGPGPLSYWRRRPIKVSGFFVGFSQTVVYVRRVWITFDVALKRGDRFLQG